jgi:hypothetical protein
MISLHRDWSIKAKFTWFFFITIIICYNANELLDVLEVSLGIFPGFSLIKNPNTAFKTASNMSDATFKCQNDENSYATKYISELRHFPLRIVI